MGLLHITVREPYSGTMLIFVLYGFKSFINRYFDHRFVEIFTRKEIADSTGDGYRRSRAFDDGSSQEGSRKKPMMVLEIAGRSHAAADRR